MRPIALALFALAPAWAQTAAPAAAAGPGGAIGAPLTELSIEELLDIPVQTATLKKQSMRDAPADVTVITAADIRRYGYRTLGEALSNVRGFYTSFDGGFQFSGVRGFSLLGDYNTRFLVMINGHHMTDNVFSAMYMFGQDFGLDMGLIEQIEIVRGPSSSLYGSNGVFATVNIITKAPGRIAGSRGGVETGSFGETKLIGATTFQFGRTGRGIVSGSAFHTFGRSADLAGPDGVRSIDGIGQEQGFHSFANVTWGGFSLTALFGERRVSVPTGFYMADLGDTGTRSIEGRNFVELGWRKPLGQSDALKLRLYYDQFRYDGIYKFQQRLGTNNYDGSAGDWVGSQFLYEHNGARLGTLTLGAETNVDLRNNQYSFYPDVPGVGREDLVSVRRRNAAGALFVQEEWSPSAAWTFYVGGRWDGSRNNPGTFAPRAAVVHKAPDASYKFTWGRAFRNASTYERYYTPSPDLVAERLQSFELTRDQKIASRVNWINTIFHYRLRGLIEVVPMETGDFQYRNVSKASATGFETELYGRPLDWLETTVGYTRHRARGRDDQTRLVNSPANLFHLKAAVPLGSDRVTLSGAVRYMGSRLNADGVTSVGGATLLDTTLTARPNGGDLWLQFGVRNLTDTVVLDPLSLEHTTTTFPRAGRSFFLKINWGRE